MVRGHFRSVDSARRLWSATSEKFTVSLRVNRGCCEQQAAYDAPRFTHISRYIRRWIPVPLITADLFRRWYCPQTCSPEDVGSTPGLSHSHRRVLTEGSTRRLTPAGYSLVILVLLGLTLELLVALPVHRQSSLL